MSPPTLQRHCQRLRLQWRKMLADKLSKKSMKWLLDSVKQAHRRIPPDAHALLRRLAPFLLLLSLLVYLLLGAALFLAYEHEQHETQIKRFHLRLGANRKQVTRQITSALFNQSGGTLVIVDRVNQARMEEVLYNQIKAYEAELPLKRPHPDAWDFTNCLTYSWGLLATIGHGNRAPRTIKGQIFALFYALVGVPFYMGTVIVWAWATLAVVKHVIRKRLRDQSITDFQIMLGAVVVYIWFIIAFSIVLFSSAVQDDYFRALYTAVLSSFTIQTQDYNDFAEFDKVLTLSCAAVSLYLGAVVLLTALGCVRSAAPGAAGAAPPTADDADEHESASTVHVVHAEKSASGIPQPAPRFQVIVDEAGESQLGSPAKKAKKVKEIHHY